MSGKKNLSKRKGKAFLTAGIWFPFKYHLLDGTHYAVVPPFISHSNWSLCRNWIPLSVERWLNGFLPAGLMSFLPFRNGTKLPKWSQNREIYHKLWSWAVLTCWRQAEADRLSSFLIFLTGFCMLGFCKGLCVNTEYTAHLQTQHCHTFFVWVFMTIFSHVHDTVLFKISTCCYGGSQAQLPLAFKDSYFLYQLYTNTCYTVNLNYYTSHCLNIF